MYGVHQLYAYRPGDDSEGLVLQLLYDVAFDLFLGLRKVDSDVWGPGAGLVHDVSGLLQEIELEVGAMALVVEEELTGQSHVLRLRNTFGQPRLISCIQKYAILLGNKRCQKVPRTLR